MENMNKIDWKWIIIAILLALLAFFAIKNVSTSANKVGATATPTPIATSTPAPTPTPDPQITITKSPSSESKTEGTSTQFIANANGYTSVEWCCATLNGSVIKAAELASSYQGVSVSGANTTTLSLSNIPLSMNGTSFYAVFRNNSYEMYSERASLTVNKKIREIKITHNPTSESRNLGYDWYWDYERSCARNDSVYLTYCVNGENIDSIQWYIYTTHASPAGNYAGVLGANAKTLSIPARSDISGCKVYAVVTNTDGQSAETTHASYTVTYNDYTPIPYTPTPIPSYQRNIYLTEWGDGSGYVVYMPSTWSVGSALTFSTALTNSQGGCQVSVSCCNTGASVPVISDGMNYTFVMPNDDVNVSVYWSGGNFG